MNYPCLKLKILSNDKDVGKFINVNESYVELQVIKYDSATSYSTINPNDSNLSIKLFDTNMNIRIGDDIAILIPNKEGSCSIGVYYNTTDGTSLYIKEELVVHDTFLKDNYMTYFLSEYDSQLIEKNTLLKIILDTCMELFDIYFAYVNDIDGLNNPSEIKSKYLQNLALSMGFDKLGTLNEGDPLEYRIDKMYRELLTNLMSLIRIRGTKTSYELFFGSLGYDIDLLEFWYNDKGELVEINSYDDELSSFIVYSAEGVPSDLVANIDPRLNVDSDNNYNRNQKSHYVLPVIGVKDESNPFQYLGKQKVLINNFLEFLKPNHIEYLLSIIKINLSSYTAGNKKDYIDFFYNEPVLYRDLKSFGSRYGYGEVFEPGTWKTAGMKFNIPVYEENKIVPTDIGIPDYFVFSKLGETTSTITDGDTVITSESNPYSNSNVISQEFNEIQQNEEEENIVSEDYSNYSELDFDDDQNPIVDEETIEDIIYSLKDITEGSVFGIIGSEFGKKTIADENDLYYEGDTSHTIIITDEETDLGETETTDDDSTDNENTNTNTGNSGNGLISNYIKPFVYVSEPPCNINHNDGRLYYGTWPWETFPRGNYIERAISLIDNRKVNSLAGIIFSKPYEIEEILHSPFRYDTQDNDGKYVYKYDANLPQGAPIDNPNAVAGSVMYYDDGIVFNMSIRRFNTAPFLSKYYELKKRIEADSTLTESWMISQLMTTFDISLTDYNNLKPVEL